MRRIRIFERGTSILLPILIAEQILSLINHSFELEQWLFCSLDKCGYRNSKNYSGKPLPSKTKANVFQKQIEVATSTARGANRKVWAGIGAYRIPSESAVEKINVARALNAEGFILFSYDFTARPSDLNPDGAYLERIRRAAF